MDKRVIFAVAGSGKTTLLIRRLREDRRTLILTFTVNNEAHLRAQIIRRFGYIPYGIRVMTWFEFLHGFCFRPFLQEQLSSRGLSFNQPPSRIPRTNIRHYQDPAGRLYHRRLAHLLTARGCCQISVPDLPVTTMSCSLMKSRTLPAMTLIFCWSYAARKSQCCAAGIFISIPLTQAATVTSMLRCMKT
ncbi:Uncharacterised protein [Escherichia coli]|nr:Uncharacterised protein [Escherichia coli]